MSDPEWYLSANCASSDPEIFFPEKEAGRGTTYPAKKICRACPVIAECLQYALSSPDTVYGVWGGMTEHERRNLRRNNNTRRTA